MHTTFFMNILSAIVLFLIIKIKGLNPGLEILFHHLIMLTEEFCNKPTVDF